MKNLFRIFTISALVLAASAFADTLELADGTLIEGDFVGSSNGIIMFNSGEEIEAFMESDVVGVYLSAGVETAEALRSQTSSMVTVPAGTRLIVRISETIDTQRHAVGHRFRGQLEGALVVDGVTAAPRGTMVYGRVMQSAQSGRLAGKSELALEITDFMLNDQLVPVRTSPLAAQSGNEAARTAGRTARAAALGGLIDGKSGARTGAKVGLGASIVTRGSGIMIPPGTLMETSFSEPAALPRP